MARVVKELGVPAGIIGKMVVTPPNENVWLNPGELRSMGTTMTGRPAQVPPDQVAGVPLQIDPTANANAPRAIEPQAPAPKPAAALTWKDVVNFGYELSQQQNNGRASINRVCQPELKLCNIAIFYKYEGKDMMIRETEDMTGRTIKNEICSFNEFNDVRFCVNWNTKETRRDMKDSKGDWSKVGDQ